jgi:hypothetical protein
MEKMSSATRYSPQPLLNGFFFHAFASATFTEFIFSQVLLFRYGSTFCHDTSYVREGFTKEVNIFISGAFILHLILNTIRIMTGVSNSNKRNNRYTIYSALIVSIIVSTSTLTSLLSPQGMCIDGYGYVLSQFEILNVFM